MEKQRVKVKTLYNFFENDENKNNIEVEKSGCGNDVIWNHKYLDSFHVDQNHTNSN